jgi:hypothetical protein
MAFTQETTTTVLRDPFSPIAESKRMTGSELLTTTMDSTGKTSVVVYVVLREHPIAMEMPQRMLEGVLGGTGGGSDHDTVLCLMAPI